jgi:hypothetical protein
MADIALVFHWPLSDLDALSLPDLLTWRSLAVDRWNQTQKADR